MRKRHSIRISKQYLLLTESAVGSRTDYHLVFTAAAQMVVLTRQSFDQPGKDDVVRCYEQPDFDSRTLEGESLGELVSQRLGEIVTVQCECLHRAKKDPGTAPLGEESSADA